MASVVSGMRSSRFVKSLRVVALFHEAARLHHEDDVGCLNLWVWVWVWVCVGVCL